MIPVRTCSADAIQPGDIVHSASGDAGTVVSVWRQTECAGTRLERERLRLVVNWGWIQCPMDYERVEWVERDGRPVEDEPVQMEMFSR